MADLSLPQLSTLLVFLIFPLLGAYLAIRLRMPVLVGYILGGIFLGLLFASKLPEQFITSFSMIGLVLLIFTIGLETNFRLIKRFGKFVILGGLIQIISTAFFVFVISLFYSFSFTESIILGLAFSMSSTAVVSKIIQEKGEENSLVGGLAIGILVFQDLAFIPLLIILSSLSRENNPITIVTTIVFSALRASIILFLVYYLGQRIIPLIFNRVAKISRELLNLLIIVFIVALLTLFSFFGLSSLLAAFIAGILIGQTLEHYHIFSQIRPLRDLLVVVFFVFLGLTLKPAFVLTHLPAIITFTILVILIKIVVVFSIYLFFRFHSKTAFFLGLYLFQIGEDAFILLYQAFINKTISQENYYFALSIVLISLFCTPFLIKNKEKIYLTIRGLIKRRFKNLSNYLAYNIDGDTPNIDMLPLRNHVIICGYGRVGRYIGRALLLSNVPFIAVDYNFHTVEHAKSEGINIIYGDPTEIDVLDYAGGEHASVVISAVPERFSQEMIVLNAKKLNPEVIIFTRVETENDQKRMRDLGVSVVVQPAFEASLSIIRRVLLWRRMPKVEIAKKIRRIKIEHGMV